MHQKTSNARVVELPAGRRVMRNMLDLPAPRHCMHGLLEVDVTTAREFLREHKGRTGESLSFTAFLTCCLAQSVDEDKRVQAYLKGRKQLVVFDDVDVGIMVARKTGDGLTGHVVRQANHKTFWEIHQEIRSVQSKRAPASAESLSWFRSALLLPWPLSHWFKSWIRMTMRRDPAIFTGMAGTVGISSVGMFARGVAGWGIFNGTHSLDLDVGSITRKPAVIHGRIEPREIMSLTMTFDHAVIDGGPAAHFAGRLVERIERGAGLAEDLETSGGQPAAASRMVTPA